MSTAYASTIVTTPALQQQARDLVASAGGAGHWSIGTGSVPSDLARVLTAVLGAVADGGTVTLAAAPDVVTTTVAAEMLGISRPTLMKIVADGRIPAHKVGTHTRLRTADVVQYRRARLERQRAAYEELVALLDE